MLPIGVYPVTGNVDKQCKFSHASSSRCIAHMLRYPEKNEYIFGNFQLAVCSPKMAVGWRANILLVGREFRFYIERASSFSQSYSREGLVTGMHICAYEFAFIKN